MRGSDAATIGARLFSIVASKTKAITAARLHHRNDRTDFTPPFKDPGFLFVSEKFKVSDADLIGLYTVSDLLFLPSKQEGFGLPLLEAGLFRLPVFCARLEPMQSVLKHNVHLFDLDDEPAAIASLIVQGLNNNTGYQARKEVITRYSWERLFDKKIGPTFLDARRELS